MSHIQLSISKSITDRRFKADEAIWIPLTTPPYSQCLFGGREVEWHPTEPFFPESRTCQLN
jgi:hypothetical protein